MMDGKDIRCKIGRSFPQYDVADFPGFDFFKAVENIFMQPYVKEWDYKTKKHIYGQGPVFIRTWYCLNSKEDYETESNKCTGNFSHLKRLISTHDNNNSTRSSKDET